MNKTEFTTQKLLIIVSKASAYVKLIQLEKLYEKYYAIVITNKHLLFIITNIINLLETEPNTKQREVAINNIIEDEFIAQTTLHT